MCKTKTGCVHFRYYENIDPLQPKNQQYPTIFHQQAISQDYPHKCVLTVVVEQQHNWHHVTGFDPDSINKTEEGYIFSGTVQHTPFGNLTNQTGNLIPPGKGKVTIFRENGYPMTKIDM